MMALHWERVKELLYQAMQVGPEQRSRFLDEACSGDAALRAEVESLLSAGRKVSSGFLPTVPQPEGFGAGQTRLGALEGGDIFAERFQLIRKLGEGGMGQVWLAEQTSPVRRPVALKLIKAGIFDPELIGRFLSERQSLAMMDHPAIAKVFDAGTTAEGQPYLVMEYVPGLTIAQYCDRKRLGIRERLELFIRACEGVQHAHQKAIIHRDLKPANILVLEVDAQPVPRIIDFGLAKAAIPTMAGESLATQLGHFVGTPGYMSPEQADPGGSDIDTRTDVYSLGVVLYVLLAGCHPFEPGPGQKLPLDEWLRKLREEDPPLPSARIGAARGVSTASAEARSSNPKHLAKQLRGDLDSIVMKTLERNRDRRYAALSDVAADISRYLRHEPVGARPASALYRLRRYARRRRTTVSVAAALALLLAGFSILSAIQLRRVIRERDRADRITDFMTSMFKMSDPGQARGNSVTAREILDKASNEMGKGLAGDAEVQSQLMHVMAQTYVNLGLYGRAHDLAKRALDARLKLYGANHRSTLESMAQFAFVLDKENRGPEAEKMARQAVAAERRNLGPEDPLTLETTDTLAIMLQRQSRFGEEEQLERDVIRVATRKLGPESAPALRAMEDLGSALYYEGRYREAEAEYRKLLEVGRRVWEPDHPTTVLTMANLALAIREQGRLTEAEALYREVLAIDRRVLGPEHPTTVLCMQGLAGLLLRESRLADAENLARETLEIRRRTLGPEHRETLEAQANWASVLFMEGQVAEAEKVMRAGLEIQIRVLGPGNIDTLESQGNLAEVLNRKGRYAEAETMAREAFQGEIGSLGPHHPATLQSLQQVGFAMANTHRYDEATRLFREVIEKPGDSAKRVNPWSGWYAFACMAAASNHPDDALLYLRQAIDRGYKDANGLMADDDLKRLRLNPRFQELVARLRPPPERAQSQEKR